jgi:hypothetical protein
MQIVKIAFAILFVVTGARTQNGETTAQPPPAAISYSALVPADTCKWVTSIFALHHLSSSMRQVEIPIDDKQAFQQESESLQEKLRQRGADKSSAPRTSAAVIVIPYDDSLLFELGGEGYVTRVVVSIELFSKIKFVPNSNGVPYATFHQ